MSWAALPMQSDHGNDIDIVERAIAVLDQELARAPALSPLASRALGADARRESPVAPRAPEKAIFHAVGQGRPGEPAELVLALINDNPQEPLHVELVCTDIAASADLRLAADRIVLRPSELTIPAGGSADVVVRIDLPLAAGRGSYTGLLRAANLQHSYVMMTVQVE